MTLFPYNWIKRVLDFLGFSKKKLPPINYHQKLAEIKQECIDEIIEENNITDPEECAKIKQVADKVFSKPLPFFPPTGTPTFEN